MKNVILNPNENCLITDTFIVKSMNGREGTGRNPTDRGRQGIKVSLVCDDQRITHDLIIGSANQPDVKLLEKSIEKISKLERHIKCLADAGYIGHAIRFKCLKKRIDLIARPRKTRSGKMTHQLSDEEFTLLKMKRCRVELLNSQIRRHRGLMIKWTRNIKSYQCFLYLIILCITCYQRYIIQKC
jgi:IS5 family transposase